MKYVCFSFMMAALCAIAFFFALQSVEAINSDPSVLRIIGYSCIGIIGLIGACYMIISSKSLTRRLINRISGTVEKTVYSKMLHEKKPRTVYKKGNVKIMTQPALKVSFEDVVKFAALFGRCLARRRRIPE